MKNPILLPRPKKFVTKEGVLNVSAGVRMQNSALHEKSLHFAIGAYLRMDGVSISVSVDPFVEREGYRLCVKKCGISLVCGSTAGEFYGLITLRQLLEGAEGELRCCVIEDAPDFHARGIMIDIGRNRIPSLETLKKLIDFVASLKMNQLQLYIEGKAFLYPSLKEYYAEDVDVLTVEDIRALETYCKERLIDLVPNQNTFGHMSEWLAERDFNSLAECPQGYLYDGIRFAASTLDPSQEESFRLVEQQLCDLIPLFSSRMANVGGDEPFELGVGASAKICKQFGKDAVYLSFMQKIFSVVKKYGKSPMMWGDVFKEHYEKYKESFPKDATLLEWGYLADSFTDESCARYADAGFRFYVCPGTSLWNTVTGKTEVMRKNVRSAAILGKKYGADGFLLTDWGDGGSCQPFVCALLPYATGAAYCWNAAASQETEINAYLNRSVFSDESEQLADLLAYLGNYYLCANEDDFNATKIFKTLYVQQTDCMNVFEGNYEPTFRNRDFVRLSKAECEKTLNYLHVAETRLQSVNLNCKDGELYLRELAWAIGYLKHGCRLGAIKAGNEQFKREELQALYDDLLALNEEYEKIWSLRNKRTGLSASMARMNALLRKYEAILG